MSFDLNVLVVGQQVRSEKVVGTSIELINESENGLRYLNIWGFMTGTEGTWYSLGTHSEIGFSALNILDPDFGAELECYPYWINNDVKSNLVPMTVKEEYKQDFMGILQSLIALSPVKTVYLMARMQGGDDEVVCGILSGEQFWKLHDEKKILFNVCYVLKG